MGHFLCEEVFRLYEEVSSQVRTVFFEKIKYDILLQQ